MDKFDAAAAYVSQSVSWGRDDEETRQAEYDAFVAGYEAAQNATKEYDDV